jgi:hypothetical protein
MRTKEMTVMLLSGSTLFGFFFRLGEVPIAAAPPQCTTWPCTDLYAWWTGTLTPAAACWSAEIAGTPAPPPNPGALDHTSQAVANLYTPASPGLKPLVRYNAPNDFYDMFRWPTNVAGCAKIGGQWPTPQTVQPAGTPAAVDTRGAPHYHCTGP